MSKLNLNLLTTDEFQEFNSESKSKGIKPRGSYNPMTFIVRLRPDIHAALNSSNNIYERMQAFSTFMHENIHWWQHVGSTIGFITSLSYPAIAHSSHQYLQKLIERNQIYKSLIKYNQLHHKQYGNHDNAELNLILNNWHDTHYAKWFIFDNKAIYNIVKDQKFFLSMGHCFHILWSSTINTLAATIDPDYKFLPKVTEWPKEFKRLESEKVQGFYIDSDMMISPIGTRQIFEGQARFNQLQYLAIGTTPKPTYEDFEQMGMLNGVYIEAFDFFIETTGIDKPKDLNNSIIGLFLLVCDVAINPTDGFPHDILDFETFIISNDPGIRFATLCTVIRKEKTKWENAVQYYSFDEYTNLSEELSRAIACVSPLFGSTVVMNWVKEHESMQQLMHEESEMRFSPGNLPIKLFVSKFIRFQEDKLKYPQFFCWTGKSMTSEASKELNLGLVEQIFNRHKALFVNDINDDLKPMLFDSYSESNIIDTFQAFYTYNTTYDMIHKWIVETGEFTYNYRWLSNTHTEQEMKDWIRNNFKSTFNIFPEDISVITDTNSL